MAVKTVDYLANAPTATAAATASTQRGPSEIIWGAPGAPGAWIEDFLQDPSLGMYLWEDFAMAGVDNLALLGVAQGSLAFSNVGQLTALVPVGGGIADAGIIGAGVTLYPGSLANSSTNQIATFLTANFGCFQIITNSSGTSALQGRLAFEARIALSSVTNGKRDAFIGLCDPLGSSVVTTQALYPFTAAGSGSNNLNTTITTNGLIGFYFPSSSFTGNPSGDCCFAYGLSNIAKVLGSNLKGLISNVGGSAIVAGTYYKLGFVFDQFAPNATISAGSDGQTVGNTARQMLRIYVNGIPSATFLTQGNNILTASFPTGIMTALMALAPSSSGNANTATNQAGTLSIDWVRCAQLAIT